MHLHTKFGIYIIIMICIFLEFSANSSAVLFEKSTKLAGEYRTLLRTQN